MTSLPTVVVIEDDPAVMESIVAMLSYSEVETRCFTSAEEFLENSGPIACIIADLRLPGMSGIELLDQLTKNNAVVPFILITGHGDPDIVQQVSDLDRVWFLEKPYQPNELIDYVQEAIKG